jgi:hypothetical protein
VTSQPDDELDDAEQASPAEMVAADNADAAAGGRQWHEIQAEFVDDPRGSVQLAAQAVDDAVAALTEVLHQRQAAMTAPGAPASDPSADTEELRETLRSYRSLCEGLSDLRRQLSRS